MTRPTSRVLALLEMLQAGGTRRVADLAQRLDVDERTVRRYAAHLMDLGIPVQSERGRYGGYRLAPGFRMPPLMLTDDEAIAVMTGLVIGSRAGLVPDSTASESALAKLRRVLPDASRTRMEAFLATAAFTAPAARKPPVDTGVLLSLAVAAHENLGVDIAYTDREGRASVRSIQPHHVVGHAGRWYLTATVEEHQQRTFRLDRISRVTQVPGTSQPATGSAVEQAIASAPERAVERATDPGSGSGAGGDRDPDPGATVLTSLARTPWAHPVSVRVQAGPVDVGRRLPPGLALVEELADDPGWVRVRLNAQRLDWVPALIAGLDLPFVIEEPASLRDRMADLAQRLLDGSHAPPGS
ncbi:YafY family protein [Kineosporia sp. NBRC 101731]|uniref:helix-turn-helix transcriptional regulator n=1 Tax=Kineosporia sp. NBRC 101731 TaxID=3032199 RepID=UPI00249FB001|nr:YafY family protein [Kineosporia sp. NBRC 101731]GLY29495.1 transcriptional regulator [Kineosporia sp. NBRC 101731]